MKTIRLVWVLFLAIAVVCVYYAAWFGEPAAVIESPPVSSEAQPVVPRPTAPAPILRDYSADARLAVAEIEARHPAFVLDGFLQDYNRVWAAYLRETAAPMRLTEFLLATQRYLTVLRDGHMGSGLTQTGQYLDVDWVCAEGRLYLPGADGDSEDAEVTRIGGVPVSEVMAQVDRHYYSENAAARELNYAAFCRQKEMLTLAGCAVQDDTVTLTTGAGGERPCGFRTLHRASVRWRDSAARYIASHKVEGDVFVIDLRAFQPDPSVDSAAGAIRTAIKQGTRKFILDLRGNGGGNSEVGAQLLRAMGMTLPQYGVYIRNSEKTEAAVQSNFGYLPEGDPIYSPPDPSTAANPNEIALVVLTDEHTFSSATMTAIWVRDGGLGTIIGRPSSNAPCAFGDMMTVTLPASGANLPISYKRFLRPDADADPDILLPDIPTERGEDAMQAALAYLAGR